VPKKRQDKNKNIKILLGRELQNLDVHEGHETGGIK
jgi:hypothetical protein